MKITSGGSALALTTSTASSACATTVTSRPGIWKVSPRAATTSSKMRMERTGADMARPRSHAELGRGEDALQQLVHLADHALGRLVVDGGQGRLDLVEVLELGEQLDVAQLAAGGEEL